VDFLQENAPDHIRRRIVLPIPIKRVRVIGLQEELQDAQSLRGHLPKLGHGIEKHHEGLSSQTFTVRRIAQVIQVH
jgi:hypothetical protein